LYLGRTAAFGATQGAIEGLLWFGDQSLAVGSGGRFILHQGLQQEAVSDQAVDLLPARLPRFPGWCLGSFWLRASRTVAARPWFGSLQARKVAKVARRSARLYAEVK